MAGNATIEQELPGNTEFQVSYVLNNAVDLYSSEWPNAYTGAPLASTPYTAVDNGLGEFQLTDNHAHSTYNALQAQVRKVSTQHGFQFQAAYTYSKTLDNASTVWNGNSNSNSATLPNNPSCYACEKSRSGFDFPHRFVMNFQYTIPADRWGPLSSLPQRLTAGWQALSIISAQSGFPWTVNSPYGTVQFGTDTYTGFQPTRPDQLQPAPLRTSGTVEEQFFSDAVTRDGQTLGQAVFATPGGPKNGIQDRAGTLGRNTFRVNRSSNVDFSLLKDTRLTERLTLQFRGEIFNLLNQHAFGQPGQVLGSPGFGVATSTILAERQIQFGLRFIF
jgi:hypothetical protein